MTSPDPTPDQRTAEEKRIVDFTVDGKLVPSKAGFWPDGRSVADGWTAEMWQYFMVRIHPDHDKMTAKERAELAGISPSSALKYDKNKAFMAEVKGRRLERLGGELKLDESIMENALNEPNAMARLGYAKLAKKMLDPDFDKPGGGGGGGGTFNFTQIINNIVAREQEKKVIDVGTEGGESGQEGAQE